jgi:hypothetical protein
MITSAWYSAVLEEKLKTTIHSKHRRMLTDEVVLHHNNSWPCMAAVIIGTIQKLKFGLCPTQHTVQISCHLIIIYLDLSKMSSMDADLQIMMRWRMQCVHGFMCNPKHSLHVITKLVSWGNKCVEKLGDYIKNDHIFFLCTICRIK